MPLDDISCRFILGNKSDKHSSYTPSMKLIGGLKMNWSKFTSVLLNYVHTFEMDETNLTSRNPKLLSRFVKYAEFTLIRDQCWSRYQQLLPDETLSPFLMLYINRSQRYDEYFLNILFVVYHLNLDNLDVILKILMVRHQLTLFSKDV